jgi:acetyl-CoA carboxylase biotin carboxyl carrier protein
MTQPAQPKPVLAHIAGTVWRIDVAVGQAVNELDPIVTLESMKMEMPVEAPKSGKVAAIKVETGQFVNEGDVIALIE